MVVIMQNVQEKADFQKTRVNATKTRKVRAARFVRTEINFVLGKNGGHTPSSLGGRSIVVIRQAGRRNTCSLQNF